MEFQHDESWDQLARILASKVPAREAWNNLIDFHEQSFPRSYWADLRQIDLESEQEDIADWIHQIVRSEPIPKNILAFWIGILKLVDDTNKEVSTIYFAGADNYDKDDIDWACDPSYLPENRYAQPPILQQIDNIAQKDKENYQFLDWILPVAYCAFTFDEIVRTKLDKNLFLKHRKKIFVAVGHDSGDYIDISAIN